jgi:hypothetical protein
MRPAARLLWAGLAITLGLSIWLAVSEDGEQAAVVGAGKGLSVDAAAAAVHAPMVGPAGPPLPPAPPVNWAEPSAHALSAWSAAAPAPPARAASAATALPPLPAASAPRPTAPAFPYRWLGRLHDESGPQALLAGNERVLGARAGDVIDSRWQVQRIDAAALQLVWLPGGQPVTVAWR